MSRVKGKSANGRTIRITFPTRRAADRFVDIWEGKYLGIYDLEIIDFI